MNRTKSLWLVLEDGLKKKKKNTRKNVLANKVLSEETNKKGVLVKLEMFLCCFLPFHRTCSALIFHPLGVDVSCYFLQRLENKSGAQPRCPSAGGRLQGTLQNAPWGLVSPTKHPKKPPWDSLVPWLMGECVCMCVCTWGCTWGGVYRGVRARLRVSARV